MRSDSGMVWRQRMRLALEPKKKFIVTDIGHGLAIDLDFKSQRGGGVMGVFPGNGEGTEAQRHFFQFVKTNLGPHVLELHREIIRVQLALKNGAEVLLET